jgi:hypothetical protein
MESLELRLQNFVRTWIINVAAYCVRLTYVITSQRWRRCETSGILQGKLMQTESVILQVEVTDRNGSLTWLIINFCFLITPVYILKNLKKNWLHQFFLEVLVYSCCNLSAVLFLSFPFIYKCDPSILLAVEMIIRYCYLIGHLQHLATLPPDNCRDKCLAYSRQIIHLHSIPNAV